MTNQYAWLQYTRARAGEQDYLVGLVSTRPRYGDLRWWFVWPLAVDGRACQRRVCKLYLPSGRQYFGCRHCYQLGYHSQRESPAERALSKVQAIREWLGGSASMLQPFPAKPKRMRWQTYYRLQEMSQDMYILSLGLALGRS